VLLDWVKLVWCGMSEARTLGLAAEMSFWLFSSLLPLAAVAGLVLARLAVSRGDLAVMMLGSTPPAARDVEPLPNAARSSRTTSTPASAR